MKLYKVNVQTYLNGFLFGVGVYDKDRVGLSSSYIEQYCEEQKALPLDKKQIPPYFEIIDTESVPVTAEEKIEEKFNSYIGMSKDNLFDLCKQRGIDVKKKMSNAELVELLIESDKQSLSGDENDADNLYGFYDTDTFLSLDETQQVEYLDEIFSVPSDIEDGSDEEVEYFNALNETVTMYGGLSISDNTIEKVKEILEFLNGEG